MTLDKFHFIFFKDEEDQDHLTIMKRDRHPSVNLSDARIAFVEWYEENFGSSKGLWFRDQGFALRVTIPDKNYYLVVKMAFA